MPKRHIEHKSAAGETGLSYVYLYGACLALRLLFDLDKFREFLTKEEAIGSAQEIPATHLEGFKFAIGLSLFKVLEEIVDCPHLLGIEPLDGLDMMLHWREGRFPIPRGDSAHEVAVRNIWHIRREIVSSKSWLELHRAIARAQPFIGRIENILASCYVARSTTSSMKASIHDSREAVLRLFLTVFYHNSAHIEHAAAELYRGGSTSAKRAQSYRLRHTGDEQSTWWNSVVLRGFGLAVKFLWWCGIVCERYRQNRNSFAQIMGVKNWVEYDDIYAVVDDLNTLLGRSQMECLIAGRNEFTQVRKISPLMRSAIIAPLCKAKIAPSSPEQLFSEIFELRPVRVLSDNNDYTAASYFTLLFQGLIDKTSAEPNSMRVLRIRHPTSWGTCYSYALFIPAFGTFLSNASEYALVLSAGTDFSGLGKQIHEHIEKIIAEAGSAVIVVDETIQDMEAFEKFLEPYQFRFLRDQTHELIDVLSAFRGSIGELLLCELLRREGYDILGLRRKLKHLGNLEVDVIAHRPGLSPEVLLVQSKAHLKAVRVTSEKGRTHHWETNRDMDDILRFCEHIRPKLSEAQGLRSELRLPKRSRFKVVVAAFGQWSSQVTDRLGSDIEFWSPSDLVVRFKAVNIPRSLWEPLERLADVEMQILSSGEYERNFFRFVDISSTR